MHRNTLAKSQRLHSKKAIELLYKKGKSFLVYPLRVVYLVMPAIEGEHPVQAMFCASKRQLRHAVQRNTLKRHVREAYRLQQHHITELTQQLGKTIYISFNTVSPTIPEHDKIEKLVAKALNTIIKKLTDTTDEPNP